MKLLILNHKQYKCGVYQFGQRIYDILKQSNKLNFIYKEINSEAEYKSALSSIKPTHILYNWHHYTMSWLREDLICSLNDLKHYFIFHDGKTRQCYNKFLFFGDLDINKNLFPTEKRKLFSRPLFDFNSSYNYKKNEVFTIGSFGFAFQQKGLDKLITEVNKLYDNALIRLQISKPFFDQSKNIYTALNQIPRKPGVKLEIITDFLSNEEILYFLAENDINVFYYNDNGEGLSSSTDFALSINRPLAVTDCTMFRHFIYDEINLNKYNVKQIYENTVKDNSRLVNYRNNNQPHKLLLELEEFFNNE